MAVPIIRMTARDRKLIVSRMAHKRTEFERELQRRVRAYLRKLNERKLLNAELEEYHKTVILEKEESLKKAETTTEKAQKIGASVPGSIGVAASTLAALGGTAATEYIKHDIETINSEELKEKIESSKLGLYIKEEQHDIIATRVAEIIGFRLQFLLFRLNGGTDGYMRLAQFLADAMEAFAIEKLRGNNNKIDALVDAAFPAPSSIRYKDWRMTWENGYHRTLDIDQECNDIIERCGPATRFLLGKHKSNHCYSIVDAINHSLILNGRGEVISGSQSKKTSFRQLEGENESPMLLLAPNELPFHLGLGHGTYLTDQSLEDEHVIALLRLIPGFFKEDLSHDMILKPSNADKEATADLVFAAERHECSWTKERDHLWQERSSHIHIELTKEQNYWDKYFKKQGVFTKKEQEELEDYIENRQNIAYQFDAKRAEADVRQEIQKAQRIQAELNEHDQDFSQRRKKQYRAAKSAEHITLAVQQLIRAIKHLSLSSRGQYLKLASDALHIARETIAATRDAPVAEHLESDKMDKMVKKQKELYETSAKHLEFSWSLLHNVTNQAEDLQAPTLTKNFVYRQKTNRYDTTCDLIFQAEQDCDWSRSIIKQVEVLLKNNQKKLEETLASNCTSSKQDAEERELLVPYEPKGRHSRISCFDFGCQSIKHESVFEPGLQNPSSSEENAEHSNAQIERVGQSIDQDNFSSNEQKSDDIERPTTQVFEEILASTMTEFQNKKPSSLLARVKKIDCYLNELHKVFTDILSSLGIDSLSQNVAYYYGQEVPLSADALQKAKKAEKAIAVAKAHQKEAKRRLKNSTKLKKPFWYYHMRDRIIHDESVILEKREELLKLLKDIETDYQEKNPDKNHRFTAAKLSAANRRIQHLTSQLPESDYKQSTVFRTRKTSLNETLLSLKREAKKFEADVNQEALDKAKKVQKEALDKIEALGSDPLSLSQAAEYARIARDAREEIIRVASGDVVASMSMAAEVKRLVQEHYRTSNDLREVEHSLQNIEKICSTDTKTITRNDLTILRLNDAKRQIEKLITELDDPLPLPAPNAALNKEEAESIRLLTRHRIEEVIERAALYSHQSKEQLRAHIKERLQKELLSQNSSLFLNWGLWALSVVSRFIITDFKTSLTPEELDDLSMQFNLAESAKSKAVPKAIMLSTKLILAAFQELEDAHQPNRDLELSRKNHSLNSLLLCDKLKWAGQLSQKEKASILENTQEPSSYQLGPSLCNVSRGSRNKKKSAPIRLIHRQLRRFCTLYLDEKKHLTNMLNEYMDILKNYRKSIEKNKILSNISSADPYHEIIPLMDKMAELIKGELKIVRDKIKSIAVFKDKLLSKQEKQRVFFHDWKARSHNSVKSSELLKALQEATEERSIKAFQRIKEDSENSDINEEFELFLNSEVISHSLEDIEEMLRSLEIRINAVSLGKSLPMRTSSFFASKEQSKPLLDEQLDELATEHII